MTFKVSPDHEAPTDAGGNNVYDITVHAFDGIHDTTQAVAITVTNVNEAPVAPDLTVVSSFGGNSFTVPDAAFLRLPPIPTVIRAPSAASAIRDRIHYDLTQ